MSQRKSLESKKYEFDVDGTMPVMEFQLKAGDQRENLHLELYNPLSNEIFEAKFSRGRIEVDRDGTLTYFTTGAERVNVSLFLSRNVTITMTKSGEVTIKTPSKIVSLERSSREDRGVSSDSIKFKIE